MGRIADERARQIRIGYSLEHDRRKGVGHLLKWSLYYLIRGRFVKFAAMVVAAWDVKHK